jgi:putative ABC transport system permease protein
MVDVYTVLAVTGAALMMGAIPAWLAFRRSLADGLTVKL